MIFYKKNIDFKEIEKFNKYADTWWENDGMHYLLHKLNPVRMDYILQRSNGIFSKKILDVGCGGGILSESMTKEGAKVTGIDPCKKLIDIAKKHANDKNLKIKYLNKTIEEYYIFNKTRKYDIITCMEVLEHVPYPYDIINMCSKLIKHNGDIFFSTINRNLKSFFTIIIGAEYILKILPYNTHSFKKFIKPSELFNWINMAKLKEQNIIGISYDLYNKFFYITKNIDINYMVHIKKL